MATAFMITACIILGMWGLVGMLTHGTKNENALFLVGFVMSFVILIFVLTS
ncbi:hypothetical protein Riggi_63 [Bacillus phage Riggi]|uniref:Uncharacterized protein n=1 Tax=Bacillus phage Riggi TaxID=2884426 RepID=U5PW50_9CAUD|nr:hypothetical protein Riggi_63 [Bacillus phage Riggi]AGY48225.1 hypothetical protein Riggi_63 [Bacillus phage Riggi]